MTPTLAQRLGLRPVRIDDAGRERLAAARAAASLYTVQASVALVAGGISGGVRPLLLACALGAYAVAATVLLAYERMTVRIRSTLALSAPTILGLLVLGMPSGLMYAPLATLLVLYVGFFDPTGHAALQVTLMTAALGLALFLRYPFGTAFEAFVLLAGILGGIGVTVSVVRQRLASLVDQAEAAKAEQDTIFSFAPAGFGLLDADLRHVRVNDALAGLMELPLSQIVGRTLVETAPFNGRMLEALARSVLESGRPVLNAEVEGADGRAHHLVSYYPVPGAAGTVGVGTAVTDVTHLKDVERRLEETNRRLTVLATTDELTGLPNRRMLGEQLDLALARARRGGLAVVVLCLDLDRFKDVNDTLGHAYGDDMLVAVAAKLREGARDTDVVARVGGDEFVIVLADLDVQEAPELAATVAERLSVLLEEPVAIGAVELKVQASIGQAVYPLDSRDAKGLLAAADAAMYAGKGALTRVA